MNSLLSGTLLLTAVGLFSQAVGFVYRIALSRLIGAETMGLYQLVMPVYSTLMSLTAAGLTVAVSTLSARSAASGDRGGIPGVRNRALSLFLTLALPLCALLVLFSDGVSVHLLGDARTRLALILLAPCVLLTGIENLHKHCFYGVGSVPIPAATECGEQLIRSGAVLGLLLALRPRTKEETVGVILLGMVVCEVFSAVTLTTLFRRRFPDETGRLAPRGAVLSIAVPVAATSLLGTLLSAANAVLLPALLIRGGAEPSAALSEFGTLWGMTLPMLSLPTGLIGALCLMLVPELARKAARGERRETGRLLHRVLSAVSTLMAPAMALLVLFGPRLARALFHSEGAGEHILPLAVGTLLGCYQSVLGGMLNGLGRQREAAVGAIVGDGVQLAVTLLTVERWGLGGFAAGFVLSALVGAALDLRAVLRATGVPLRAREWFFIPLLSALLMGAWGQQFLRILEGNGLASLPACAIAAVFSIVLYLAALQGQGLFPRRRNICHKDDFT